MHYTAWLTSMSSIKDTRFSRFTPAIVIIHCYDTLRVVVPARHLRQRQYLPSYKFEANCNFQKIISFLSATYAKIYLVKVALLFSNFHWNYKFCLPSHPCWWFKSIPIWPAKLAVMRVRLAAILNFCVYLSDTQTLMGFQNFCQNNIINILLLQKSSRHQSKE